MTRWMTSRLAAPVLLFLLCTGFYWKLVLTDQYTWLNGPDTTNQILPWYQYQAGEWHRGRFPAWDPYLWGGQSLIGQAQPGAAYPLNWLLFLAPLKNGWMRQNSLHWYYVLIHFQAALFCFWLCRDFERSRGASLVAGLVFGLGGWMGSTDWPQMLNGAVWAPAIFLFFLRARRGLHPWANSALSGACLGMSFLSGHHQIPTFLTLAIGGAWLFELWRDRYRWRYALVFAAFLVATSSFQTLPAYEYGKTALRWVGASTPVTWEAKVPYHIHNNFSFFPAGLIGILIPGFARHANGFMGVTAVLLAWVAIVAAWREPRVRLFTAILLGGLFLALGGQSILHGVLYALVPMVEKARNPSMAILVFNFGLSVLTAYGIDYCSDISDSWRKRLLAGLLVFGVAVSLVLFIASAAKFAVEDRIGLAALAAFLLAGIFSFASQGRLSRTAFSAAVVFLLLFELSHSSTWAYPNRDVSPGILPNLSQHGDIAAFLQAQPQLVRVTVDEKLIDYNFGDWYGIDQWGGYLASLTFDVTRAVAVNRSPLLYGSNFYVGKEPKDDSYRMVFQSSSGLKVYRVPGAYPRAWIVHSAQSVARVDEIPGRMSDLRFDPRRAVLLAGALPPLEECGRLESVAVAERNTQRVRLTADIQCRGMVILGETWAPGWKVMVDHRPAKLYEAFGFLRGVALDPGRHTIEMVYRPASLLWGGVLTAFGLLGAAVLRWLRV